MANSGSRGSSWRRWLYRAGTIRKVYDYPSSGLTRGDWSSESVESRSTEQGRCWRWRRFTGNLYDLVYTYSIDDWLLYLRVIMYQLVLTLPSQSRHRLTLGHWTHHDGFLDYCSHDGPDHPPGTINKASSATQLPCLYEDFGVGACHTPLLSSTKPAFSDI